MIVPVFNEARTVRTILDQLTALPLAIDLIVVDDGSTDGSREILTAWHRDNPSTRLLLHPTNAGKTQAIRTALQHAVGRYTVIQDADLEYDPRDLLTLLKPLTEGAADAVYGSRRLCADNHYPLDSFLLGSLLMTLTSNVLFRLHLTDEPTCYKLVRTDTLRSFAIESSGFDYCAEVTAKLGLSGARIVELPIRYNKRSVAEGKKIRWRDGVSGLATLWLWRLRGLPARAD